MKKRLIKIVVTCSIAAVVGLGGYYGYNKYFASKPVQAANQYITFSVRRINLQVNIQGTGSAYAAVSKDIMANNSGVIKNLNVKVGDTVKAGDKLFTAYSEDLSQNITKAQNNLDKEKLSLANAKDDNEKSMDNLAISDAQNQLDYAWEQYNSMTVKAPIGGIVSAVNNANGDSVQPSNAVLSIMDPNSMKIKVAVDELDINKVKVGMKAQINFGAIPDKAYGGTVESIALTGTSTNNVTTYDVIVGITNPAGIKAGMNANVSIAVASKENALVIPAEALIEANGRKLVMVAASSSSTTSGGNASFQNRPGQSGSNNQASGANSQGGNGQNNSSSPNGNRQSGRNAATGFSGGGRLVQVTTGLENESYIEILSGLTEGERVLIELPQVNSGTNNNNNRNGFGGGFGGGMGGFGGGMGGLGGGRGNGSNSRNGGNAGSTGSTGSSNRGN